MIKGKKISMQRFEFCNVKSCVPELLALGNNNMKMWNIFQWLSQNDDLQHGTQAEILKLYVDDELVAYSLLENYLTRRDKVTYYRGGAYPEADYQELGVVHFITLDQHRNKGYATLLAEALYSDILAPMLAEFCQCNCGIQPYVTATGRAAPLMARTALSPTHLITQFYSDATFELKVVGYLMTQHSPI
jgi:hypothetical protein